MINIVKKLGDIFTRLLKFYILGVLIIFGLVVAIHSFFAAQKKMYDEQWRELSIHIQAIGIYDDRLTEISNIIGLRKDFQFIEDYNRSVALFYEHHRAMLDNVPNRLVASYRYTIANPLLERRNLEQEVLQALIDMDYQDITEHIQSLSVLLKSAHEDEWRVEQFIAQLDRYYAGKHDIIHFYDIALSIFASFILLLGLALTTKKFLNNKLVLFSDLEKKQTELLKKILNEEKARKEAEEILKESFESLTDGFAVYDKDDRLLYYNQSYPKIYYKSAHAIQIGVPFRKILQAGLEAGQYPQAGVSQAEQEVWLEKRLKSHCQARNDFIQKTSDGRWLLIRERRTPSGYIVGLRSDITDIKNTERSLRQQEAKNRRLANVAARTSNLVVVYEYSGKPLWVNDSFVKVTGYDLEDLSKKHILKLVKGAETCQQSIQTMMDNLGQGLPYRGENIFYRADGTELCLNIDIQPVFDNNGKPVEFIAVLIDMSERRKADLALKSYAEELKRYAYIASHDLQEPLRKISSYMDFLQTAVLEQDQEAMDHSMEVLQKAVRRGRNLVSDLLRYSKMRERAIDKKPFSLNSLLHEIVSQLQNDNAEALCNIEITLPPIKLYGDQSLINQVLVNLIGNAIKYKKADDRPSVQITLDWDKANHCYRLNVTDNGIGFDNQFAQQIFEPFKRLVTKDDYEGTGIGLSLVHSIVQKHGWSIEARGEPGQGSVFSLCIPQADCQVMEDPVLQPLKAS
jgi:PAS domain S-box-containing protein